MNHERKCEPDSISFLRLFLFLILSAFIGGDNHKAEGHTPVMGDE
jgi:hypothetical protein